jgi:hypothetical protein
MVTGSALVTLTSLVGAHLAGRRRRRVLRCPGFTRLTWLGPGSMSK